MTLLLIGALFLNIYQADLPEKQRVSSTVEHVTVYLNGAQLSRTAQVSLQAGSNTVIFNRLSTQFREESIQLTANRPISLLSVSKATAEEIPATALLDSLNRQKHRLESELQKKKAEETILQRELDILISNKELGGTNQKITAADLRQAMDFFREKLTDIETTRLEITNDISDINKTLEEINRQIESVRQQQQKKSGQIIAEIESPEAQNVRIDFSYLISDAGWYPSYDVSVEDTDQPLKLSYKANIQQNSGIDWEQVRLSVSSARPLSPAQLPDIEPVYLRFPEAENRQRYEDLDLSAELTKKQAVQPLRSQQDIVAINTPAVSVSQNQTSFRFDIDQPYTISGDGTAQTIVMQQHSLDADYRYLAIPKVRPDAYLTAMITDWEKLNLLSGWMHLYFEQTFVGKSRLQPETPGDTLRFTLGKDERIILQRERLQEFTDKNFFGNRVRETYAWQLTARNTRDQPIKLRLIDQVPVSTHEDIEVELLEDSGAEFQSQTGELIWNLDITGGTSAQRELRYRIEYPSDKKLNRP